MTEEKGGWFRVMRRGRRLVLKHQGLKVFLWLETRKISLKEETIVWKP